MRCPYCQTDDDRVVDSRAAEAGAAIRRRRECRSCHHRFSTYERIEQSGVLVRKRSGIAEPFDRNKLRAGIEKATKNLPVTADQVRDAVSTIDHHLRASGKREVDSKTIGAEVLEALRAIDHVAYMRFASVYKGFTSPEDFTRELATLEKDAPPKPPSG
ncbi:MAG: transcriptional regulator NrdR [Chloroflexota bacterium]|nr:transcriptional regulator NrdR [Chloroflexota bacterium]